MKILFSCLTFILLSASYSAEDMFTVREQDKYFFIEENNSGDFISVTTFNNKKPKIIKIVRKKKLKLVYFEGGEAGTSKQIKHEMVAIFDTEKNEFNEQTYITKFIGLGPEAQPKFEIKEGQVIYSLPKN